MIQKPYRRITRPVEASDQTRHVEGALERSYLMDPEYAPNRVELTRAYRMIEHDLVRLFEYIEPANGNLSAYSHRLYELLLRASTEFETNCKGILQANAYVRSGDWNIQDYCKVNAASRLSEYELRISIWRGPSEPLRPLRQWSKGHSLTWYKQYNDVKHDRTDCFESANLANVLHAVAAVFAVLFSQFYVLCFRDPVEIYHVDDDGWFSHTNSVFTIKPATSWTQDECYGFDWSVLRRESDRFATYPFA